MQAFCAAQKPEGAIEPPPSFDAEFYKPYEAAVNTAFSLLCTARADLRCTMGCDCIRAVTYRLKSPASICGKLMKKHLPVHAAAAGAVLHDVAGLRVVLSSVEAVYQYAALLQQSPIGECFTVHDYIASPKPSGYRSLHLLIRVPVCTGGMAQMVPVEIQLRTEQMDIWASIEHELAYKPLR